MIIETDDFSGKGITGFNYHREPYIARVVIKIPDFERLKLATWRTEISPCEVWCRAEFGQEVRRWKMVEINIYSWNESSIYYSILRLTKMP